VDNKNVAAEACLELLDEVEEGGISLTNQNKNSNISMPWNTYDAHPALSAIRIQPLSRLISYSFRENISKSNFNYRSAISGQHSVP
jgi:hypothetical protein